MEITKADIGRKFYFVDRYLGDGHYVIEHGTIISVLPKYNFQDSFWNSFKREENILFEVPISEDTKNIKSVSNTSLIFKTLSDVISYCKIENVVFGFSVLYYEQERNSNDNKF